MPSRREFVAGLGATLGVMAAGVRAPAALPTLRRGEWSTLNVSTQMSQFGRPNMTPNDPAVDATQILNEAIGLAISERFTTIVADPGRYYFPYENGGYVLLNGVSDLTIDLQGSLLIFLGVPGNATALASAFLGFTTSGLTLRNFSVDYDPLPFSQFDIMDVQPNVRAGQGTLTVAPQIGFQSLHAIVNAIKNPSVNAIVNPPQVVGFVYRDGRRLYTTGWLFVDSLQPDTGVVSLSDSNTTQELETVRAGDVLVIAVRNDIKALSFFGTSGLVVENVSIYASGGPGVGVLQATSSRVAGVNVIPAPGTARLVSTNADGITLEQVGANNRVEGCTLIAVQDDSVSVNSLTLGAIDTIAPDRKSVVIGAQYRQVTPIGMRTLLFVDPTTCQVHGPALGIRSIVPLIPDPPQSVTVTFDGPLPTDVKTGFYACDSDPEHRGQGLVVSGNRVLRSCFSRGMSFWGLSGITVQDNYFSGTDAAAIHVLQKTTQYDWICLPNQAVTVQANVVENCDQGVDRDTEMEGAIAVVAINVNFDVAPAPVHTEITVRDNYVVNTPRAGLSLENILTGSAERNILQLTASPPVVADHDGPGLKLGPVTSDAAIQIAVSPPGGVVGDPVVPGGKASATLLTTTSPPPGPLSFLLMDSGFRVFAPSVTGRWPSFELAVPSEAVGGVAGLQISAAGAPVARGGMFIAAGS